MARIFGSKGPLGPGSGAFFGVVRRVEDLLRSLAGDTAPNGMAVWGPRRSGLTSALHQLRDDARRALFPALRGSLAVYIDWGQHRRRPDEAIAAACNEIARAAGAPDTAHGGLRGAVQLALREIRGRLVVLIDNFSSAAPYLTKDHQREIRSAFYKIPRAACVVATSVHTDECLEFFGDEISDVRDVISLPVILSPLSAVEIGSGLAQSGVEPHAASEWAEFVHARVGGYAAWVQAALGVVERFVSERFATGLSTRPANLSDYDREALEGELHDELGQHWALGLRDLGAKELWWLDRRERPDEQTLERLRLRGWVGTDGRPAGPLLERWLRGQRLGEMLWRHSPRDVYERVLQAVNQLNWKGWDGGIADRDLVSTGLLARHDVQPHLRRGAGDRESLGKLVAALQKLLFEGTDGRYQARRTLPAFCYTDERSPIVCLQALTVGGIDNEPTSTPAACAERGVALCEEVVQFLERLAEKYPWTGDEAGARAAVLGAGDRAAETEAPTADAILEIDETAGLVRVGGVDVAEIRDNQFELLRLLCAADGTPIDRKTLARKARYQPGNIANAFDDIRKKLARHLDEHEAAAQRVRVALRAEGVGARLVATLLPKSKQGAYRLGVAHPLARRVRSDGDRRPPSR